MTIEAIIAMSTVLIAVATAWAAVAASRAANATHDAVRGQLFQQLMTEYASTEMGTALQQLRPVAWDEDQLQTWALRAAVGRPDGGLNSHRRFVSHFFAKATRLAEESFLTGLLREEIVSLAGRKQNPSPQQGG